MHNHSSLSLSMYNQTDQMYRRDRALETNRNNRLADNNRWPIEEEYIQGWFRYVHLVLVCTSRRCFCVWISDEAAVGLNQDMSEGPSSSSLAVIISIWGWRRDRGLKEKRAAGLVDDILRFCLTVQHKTRNLATSWLGIYKEKRMNRF